MKKKASKKKAPAVGWVYNNGKDMTLSQMAEQYAGHLLEVWRANWHGRAADCDDSINEVAEMAYKMAQKMMEKRNAN